MFNHRTPAATQKPAIDAMPNLFHRFMMLGLFLLGVALRLYRLGGESLWYDETVSVYLAALPLTDLIAHTARDIHPPAYYLLLHFWRLLTTPTVAFGLEYLYAWPSFALDVLVMALTYAVAKRAFGSTAALWALALVIFHPVQIWFAQEVRMYALGAFCLLLTLWAVLPLLIDDKQTQRSTDVNRLTIILYPIAALLGLYTLYYFLFWLVILNLCVVIRLWKQSQALRSWIVLQLVVGIGWLPWLPIFLRQAITPPVPAWRVPWQNVTEVGKAISEALAALWVGHTPPLTINWHWAILIVVVGGLFYVYAKSLSRQSRLLWLLLAFGPLLLLIGVTFVGLPIYHVRYIATYAPAFVLLLASLLANLRRFQATTLFVLFAAISGLSLQQLWTNPQYAADDHRSAVATLARQWRPGDVILVNAGWVYTALSVYWPTELPTPDATRPPAIANIVRLGDPNANDVDDLPLIVRTGSVNGEANLGWGLPESDFFAISDNATVEALTQLAATHQRIWHYRLYDTVSDPTGVIRQWLTDNTTLEFSQPIPGRDFLLLEGYRTHAPPPAATEKITPIYFPDAAISLVAHTNPATIAAGETLYVNFIWESTEATSPATPSALSLRLYDNQGQFLLQNDSPIVAAPAGSSQWGALPIPANTIPGKYTVAIVVYSPDTLEPYPAATDDGTELPSPITLGDVEILPPLTPRANSDRHISD